ncbi:MAG: transcriptional regulator, partial [Phycisphaerae bacterium SM23_30]
GSMGDYGCFSFFPSKNLGGAGDGGMVVTNDDQRAERLRRLRVHGAEYKYYHQTIGGNFRFDALQAAVVMVKLRYLEGWTAGRQANARRYNELFGETGLVEKGIITLPEVATDHHIFNQYVIRAERREELREFLRQKGVGHEVYYPVPLHQQECFGYLGYKAGDFPESEKAARETLALPIYAELSEEQAAYVAGCIGSFYGSH